MEVNSVKPAVSPDYGLSGAATEKVKTALQNEAAGGAAQKADNPLAEVELTPEDTKQITETMNKFMQSLNADLQFSMHEKTQRIIVKLVDTKTSKVLKEFPPHELLDTLAAISEYVGALLDKKA
jgi:flagellar protein FlaG